MCVALVLFHELSFTNTESLKKPYLPTQPHQCKARIASYTAGAERKWKPGEGQI